MPQKGDKTVRNERNEGGRCALLRRIQETDFAVTEANLFLDTHPDCRQALEYFNENADLLAELTAQFEAAYGPITARGGDSDGCWQWVDSPWPWQIEFYENERSCTAG